MAMSRNDYFNNDYGRMPQSREEYEYMKMKQMRMQQMNNWEPPEQAVAPKPEEPKPDLTLLLLEDIK